ncbi:MAG: hypothetical protein AAF531_23815 [Actinomycetota bacterium]
MSSMIEVHLAWQRFVAVLELDVMPPPDTPAHLVPDCDWNTEQLADVMRLVLATGIEHGVHPAHIVPDESDWPPVPWGSGEHVHG